MKDAFPRVVDATFIQDDFLGNSAVADATLGTIDWELVTIANASSLSFVASQNGILRFTTASTAGDGEVITTHPDGIVLSGTNQQFGFRVRIPDISNNTLAGNNFRIGFRNVVTAGEPSVGVWVDCDAGVLSIDGASTNGDLTQAVASHPDLTSGTTMVKGDWYDFWFVLEGENANGGPATLKLFINDYGVPTTINNFLMGSAETMEFGITHWCDTGGGDTLELDVDYIWCELPRN